MRYRTNEHADRSLFWQSSEGFFFIVCNLILYAIARHVEAYGGIAAWRCISLFLGSLTLCRAIACYFILGSPHEVHWLSEDEKLMAYVSHLIYLSFSFYFFLGISLLTSDRTARTISNQLGEDTTGKKWSWPQVIEAFKDPQLYFSFVNSFLANIPNGYVMSVAARKSGSNILTLFSGITTFSSLMYETFGFDDWESMLYGCPRNGI